MNKHYTQIAEVAFPVHEDEESLTTLHIFDVDDEKAEELDALYGDPGAQEREVMYDLNVSDDYGVAPGAPFHRFSVVVPRRHIVFLYDTLAYNV